MHVEIHHADGPEESATIIELEMKQPPRIGDAIAVGPYVAEVGHQSYRVIDVVWVFNSLDTTLDHVMIDVVPIS